MSQNGLILPKCILPMHKSIPLTFKKFSTLSVNTESIPFFSSCGMHQTYHLAGCHATGINSLLTSILSALRCVYSSFNPSSKNCCRQNLSPSLITQINNIAAFFNAISYGNLSLVSINSFKFFDVHSFNFV